MLAEASHAKAVAHVECSWARAFARWPIFNILLFLDYLTFFMRFFFTEEL